MWDIKLGEGQTCALDLNIVRNEQQEQEQKQKQQQVLAHPVRNARVVYASESKKKDNNNNNDKSKRRTRPDFLPQTQDRQNRNVACL